MTVKEFNGEKYINQIRIKLLIKLEQEYQIYINISDIMLGKTTSIKAYVNSLKCWFHFDY